MVIGVLVSGLFEEYTNGICEGIKYIAEQDDNSVVIIPGKYLEKDLSINLGGLSEYQFNSSFSYGHVAGFDGLIIEMASVSMFASDQAKKRFTSHFKDIPHVYISYEEENSCNVFIDNRAGMLEALDHLYRHGSRSFVMIGGPKDNYDAIVRRNTFFEFLKETGLPCSDDRYQDGDFILDCSEQIFRLLDDHPDADAFICANDILARNVCDCLRERGITPGMEISVLGYDDSSTAINQKPSLSSVRTDFPQLGIESYKALLKIINGEKIDQVSVPTKFILRDSFVSDKTVSADDISSVKNSYHFESIVRKNVSFIQSEELDGIKKEFADLSTRFVNIEDFIGRDDEVLQYLDAFSERINRLNYISYIDVDLCKTMLERRYQMQMELCRTKDAQLLLGKIYMRLYYNMINSVAFHYTSDLFDVKKKHMIHYFSQETFSFEHGDDSSFTHLLARTDIFGIKNAFVYIYEEPKFMFPNEDFRVPEYLLLKAVMNDGKVWVVSSAEQRIHRSQILCNDFVRILPGNPMMLFPLFSNEILYGIIICDYDFGEFENSGVFVAQLSSAAKMITTLRANDTLMSEYEETLQVLKSNNIELENLSKSDYLTGLVNRRGFKSRAEEMLKTCRENRQSMMVVYADMNNLKIINDKYGHQDGDFALMQIARILQETILPDGIASRIGGDEFACAIPYGKQVREEQLIRHLYDKFEEFNRSSDKEYLVEISAGAYIISPTDDITLSGALDLADEELYKEKKKRSKNIFKSKAGSGF